MNTPQATECQFDIGGFCLRGKRWGRVGGQPVLALHGWLDNAASFDFLAPELLGHLPGLDLVCLDLAGHGLSDHRNHRGPYNIFQDVGEIFAVADHLGWSQFSLMGHSRGAIIAMLSAGTFPERVTFLALLEGILPQVDEGQAAPETLAQSITDINRQVGKPRGVYASFAGAVSARENSRFALSHTDARALAERGVEQTDGRYVWRYDTRLVATSEVRLTLEQADAFVDRISAPRLLVLAEDSFLRDVDALQAWLSEHPELPRATVPGGHHCHMSQQARQVAGLLRQAGFGS